MIILSKGRSRYEDSSNGLMFHEALSRHCGRWFQDADDFNAMDLNIYGLYTYDEFTIEYDDILFSFVKGEYSYYGIDNSRGIGGYPATQLLSEAPSFPKTEFIAKFQTASTSLPIYIRDWVLRILIDFPGPTKGPVEIENPDVEKALSQLAHNVKLEPVKDELRKLVAKAKVRQVMVSKKDGNRKANEPKTEIPRQKDTNKSVRYLEELEAAGDDEPITEIQHHSTRCPNCKSFNTTLVWHPGLEVIYYCDLCGAAWVVE